MVVVIQDQVNLMVDGEDWQSMISFEVETGPLPYVDTLNPNYKKNGIEMIVEFKIVNFHNGGIFFTDSNGLGMIKREHADQKSGYKGTMGSDSKVTENYYPVTSAIQIIDIDDPTRQLLVMNDRTQGGSSIIDGSIELMQNRRIRSMDTKGVGTTYNVLDSATRLGVSTKVKYQVQINSNT